MKAKNLLQLISLTTSLYMMSKDEKIMAKVSDMTKKGKDKLNDLYNDLTDNNEEELTEKILKKAVELKDEIETKIEETALKVYQKMKIANTDEIMNLQSQIEIVKKELALAEAKIINLETINK
jgi:hypothetical protein